MHSLTSSSYCLELSFWQEICVCDWAGFSFQIKFLYRDKADDDIQWKHVRQIALPRVTQVRLFKLNCIQMLAGRSYRKNYDFFKYIYFLQKVWHESNHAVGYWKSYKIKLHCNIHPLFYLFIKLSNSQVSLYHFALLLIHEHWNFTMEISKKSNFFYILSLRIWKLTWICDTKKSVMNARVHNSLNSTWRYFF